MSCNSQVVIKKTPEDIALAAAYIFSDTAASCISDNRRFAVALSGGSTPRLFHRLISKQPFNSKIPWDNLHIFWSDERFVPYDHPYSNFGAAKADLIDHVPIPAHNIHPMPVDLFPDIGAIEYEKELIRYFDLTKGDTPRFDLMFLGLGADGHTASLFPGSPVLEERQRLVAPVKGGEPDTYRLTMTLSVINNTRKILMLVSGNKKAEILREILEGNHPSLPAQKIRPVYGSLVWLVDEAAASLTRISKNL
ncbi:6-phosphogluconolactonase [uncultured Desulfobacterium sp.]|uniref:6-phosphogluconolactonase n=1 Tax=uncultured Desulfobacterium sp. TaxID=201089 RepID=A0A445MYU8_9BACT|nr:6-phosphogluconolactonase [uncultured Desulfobacterium sp.]